jgi:hypothetical protein
VQIVRNERLVKREARIATILVSVTFVLLLIGMYLTFQVESLSRSREIPEWVPMAVTYAIILVGMGLFYLGNIRLRRYGPQYRQDLKLKQLLKGLDDRHVLYAFLGGKLPDYVLVGPSGIYVLTTRIQDGEMICRDDRWVRHVGPLQRFLGGFYGNPLGSPSYDTRRGIQRVKELIDQSAQNGDDAPEISGLIVFTADNVKLRTERCSYPATTARELRRVLTRSKGKISATRLTALRAAFENALPEAPRNAS